MKYLNCVFILALAGFASSVAVRDIPSLECAARVCPTEYRPVCGHLEHAGHKIYRTFFNACMLQSENCQYPLTRYVAHGFVDQTCAQQKLVSMCYNCSDHFIPVCGVQQHGAQTFYITFSNKCSLLHANCQDPNNPFEHLGKEGQSCEMLGIHNACPTACTAEQAPVCGMLHTEGHKIYKTFGNVCLLGQTVCQNPGMHYVQQGNVGQSCDDLHLFNECLKYCPKLVKPRCGMRRLNFGRMLYRSFGNNCLLMKQNCEFPALAFHADGEVGKNCLDSS